MSLSSFSVKYLPPSIRFLWVALQIQSLSEEESDEAIRSALEDLPQDLHATFERILKRNRKGKTEYQGPLLKLISAAHRPLTVNELREALSVTPNDPEWRRDRLINDVRATIGCCGSLITVDEEELSVRLIHQSVLQFLLSRDPEGEDPPPWHFLAEEASIFMGEVAVTYLNYGIFETQVSTSVAPNVAAAQLTDRILDDALGPSGIAGKLALMLLRGSTSTQSQQRSTMDINRTLADAWNRHRRQQDIDFSHFLPYASRHWLPHTTWVEQGSQIYQLWRRVYNNPKFDVMLWTQSQMPTEADDLIVDEETGTIWRISPTVAWSISNNHVALLRAELTGQRWARSFASVIHYLSACMNRPSRPVFDTRMATKLLHFAVLFESPKMVRWLSSMEADGTPVLQTAISNRAHGVLRALLRGRGRRELLEYLCSTSLLHHWASVGDFDSLECTIVSGGLNLDLHPLPGTAFGDDTLLQTALKGHWTRLEDVRRLINTVAGLLDLGADPAIATGNSERCLGLLLRLSWASSYHVLNLQDTLVLKPWQLTSEYTSHLDFDREHDWTFSDIEDILEIILNLDNGPKDRPEWLRGVIQAYISLRRRFLGGCQDEVPERIQRLHSSARHIMSIQEHYLRVVEMLMRHGYKGIRAKFVRGRASNFGGVMRYLLASHGIDVSAINLLAQNLKGGPPLALRAAGFGENFLHVTKDILQDDLSAGAYNFEDILAMATTDVERDILKRAYALTPVVPLNAVGVSLWDLVTNKPE